MRLKFYFSPELP